MHTLLPADEAVRDPILANLPTALHESWITASQADHAEVC